MKNTIKIISLIAVLALFFVLNTIVLDEPYNANSQYGSFKQKLERANSMSQENKFIVIGGSASNLAFDSKFFEELSGKPAVNLAVSAGVPLRVYMKAAEDCAIAGDVIIMPLEYEYYARSFYDVDESYVDVVSVDPSLKCKETFFGNIEYCSARFLRSFSKFNDCFMFALKNKMKTQNTIYIADSVDEYGDFCLHENREPTYKRVVKDKSFEHDSKTLEEIKAFIERMEENGVAVYVSYPAYDLYSVEEHEDFRTIAQGTIEKYISTTNIIGTPLDFAYDEDFFFDTVYHIKYENKRGYTEDLFRCYQLATKRTTAA